MDKTEAERLIEEFREKARVLLQTPRSEFGHAKMEQLILEFGANSPQQQEQARLLFPS